MFVNPHPYTNGVEEGGDLGYAVEITVSDIRGYQGNPLVITEDNELKRETYELQRMIDPGDPQKEREIWHMFPGVYEFTSDVYVNVPKDCVAYVTSDPDLFIGGVNTSSIIMKPGYKGLIQGQLSINGGEMFVQPGTVIGHLVMQKIETVE